MCVKKDNAMTNTTTEKEEVVKGKIHVICHDNAIVMFNERMRVNFQQKKANANTSVFV